MKIALAIPHTPWIPERVESMRRLRGSIGVGNGPMAIFDEKAPNTVWSVHLWQWLRDTGADWGLQLQDDVTVSPCFWPALRAMLSSLPPEAGVVGLTSVHPMGPEIARRGHRWYVSPGNVVGWAYAMRHEALEDFLEYRASTDDAFRALNEDDQIGEWCRRTSRMSWHPVPAICDHDVSVPSTYKNDRASLRRPSVTWRDYEEGSLTDPSWWTPPAVPERLAIAPQRTCWFCLSGQSEVNSAASGCGICRVCVVRMAGHLMGVQVA